MGCTHNIISWCPEVAFFVGFLFSTLVPLGGRCLQFTLTCLLWCVCCVYHASQGVALSPQQLLGCRVMVLGPTCGVYCTGVQESV